MPSRFKIKHSVPKVGPSEAMIQDLLQELKYRMPNDFYKYTDKLEEGDLIKYRDRLKVKVLRSNIIGKTNQPSRHQSDPSDIHRQISYSKRKSLMSSLKTPNKIKKNLMDVKKN